MVRLARKTALITGGAKGIGEAIVRLFALEGANIAIADIDYVKGKALAESLRDSNGQVIFLKTDITKENSVENTAQTVVDTFGSLDILINNAGVTEQDCYLEDETVEEWNRVLSINLHGAFLNCKFSLPYLKKSKGCIINVASMAGLVGIRYCAAYCTSKAGMIGLTRAIAVDYGPSGVRANVVCPGPCETPLLKNYFSEYSQEEVTAKISRMSGPIGRICQPEEIAKAVLFLASSDSSYMTGAVVTVDGGFTAV